jgi:DNA-binding NarL/FixJ family response regulator
MTIRVVIADDQTLVRSGLAMILATQPDIAVVGEADDGAQAVQLARQLRPDVVLMDIRMPGTDGLSATRTIVADPLIAATKVVMLTTYDLDEYLFEALRAGATGFLLKGISPEDLIRGIRETAAGEGLLAPPATTTPTAGSRP